MHDEVVDFEDRTPWEHVDPAIWTEERRTTLIQCIQLKQLKHLILLFEASVVTDAQEESWPGMRDDWLQQIQSAMDAFAVRDAWKRLPRSMKWYNATHDPGESQTEDEDEDDKSEANEEDGPDRLPPP